MIYDKNNQPEKWDFEVDICIIGSGAGGAITAAKMSAQGHSVLILEQGAYVSKEDFDQDESRLIKKMYHMGGALATDDMSIRILAGQTYGGSTTINWMNCFRTPDYVLKEWSDDYGLTEYLSEHMQTHFDEIETRMKVHEVPNEDHSPQNLIIINGSKKLGISATNCYNNSDGCIGCGKCGLGCSYDAKMDMRMTYLADALNKGTTILTDTRAERIEYKSKDSQLIHAVFDERGGARSITVRCKRTVVAGNAIGTPLLLQKSGLGKGVVGKYFHIHPVVATVGLYEHEINPTYGIPMSAVSHHYEDRIDGYGFWQEVPDLEVFLAGVNLPLIGELRRNLMQKLNNMGVIISLTRDGASKKSSGEIKWRGGFNGQNARFSLKKVPSIRYKIDPLDMDNILASIRNSIEIHFAAGAKKVYPMHFSGVELSSPDEIDEFMKQPMGPNQITMFSAHPQGTARMGKDPKTSVVNEKLEMHNYPGVYVADSSVLPTAIGRNPMISILGVVSRGIELGNLGL
ncbi:MAG: GMC family oxidoreductase [Candidatus Heimdallarchaeota archaeon]|nr:GMC family oxidoreductase [Candidatus Heimdallarchaeota archaeon]